MLERTAVVTGAGSNIGRAIAHRLADASTLVVALDRDHAALRKLSNEIRCEVLAIDLGEADGTSLGAELVSRFGPISFVVNNVGIRNNQEFLNTNRSELTRVFNTNLFCPWLMTKEIVAELVARGDDGSVVWISSVHDHRRRGYPAYSSSKAAIAMLVIEMAAELGPYSIRVNAVSPGAITEGPRRDLETERHIPLGRRSGLPTDIAEVVDFLLSDAARYVTGANWVVDGGLTTHSWMDDRMS